VTAPATPPKEKSLAERLLVPQVAWPVLLAALILLVLLTPTQELTPLDRQGPLTTTSTSPAGARGLYEVAKRLGWPVVRQRERFAAPLDSSRVYLVLDPPLAPSAIEVHALVDAVRRGAGLVYVASGGTELDDSLHVRSSLGTGGTMIPPPEPDMEQPCQAQDEGSPAINWYNDSVHLYLFARTRAWPDDTTTFAVVRPDSARRSREPAAVGYPLGTGRVVVLSDPDMLRNDVIRVCRWGLGPTAVRMLEYASAGGRPPLVFDEYHFGSKAIANWWAAAAHFLTGTSPGRAVAQIAVAGLILLAASAWRPVVPMARKRIERRSALEHVEALARAYARVSATRTAVRRLIRGLRRRHARKGVGSEDDAYLAALAARNPRLAGDVRRIVRGLDTTLTPTELLAVGRAVDHIDRVLST
jgi:uncharacterized protein DUF4350